jgi:membrane fusion protein, heavy metal efflux system
MKNFLFSFLILLLFNGLVFAHGDDEEPAKESSASTLSKIELSSEQEKILGLRTSIVKLNEVRPAVEASGTIEEIPNLHFQVNSPVKGRVSSINVTLGSQVQKGQTLAIIESQEVTQLSAAGDADQANYRSQVAQARANLELERKRYEREKSLYEHKINSQKELEAAENSLKNAQASLKAAEQNLAISTDSTQKRLSQIGGTRGGQVYLKAPLAGQINEINMTLGQTVDLGQTLIHGVNLSEVWISGQVFEKDINKIKLKQKIKAFPTGSKEAYDGKVIFINPLIDPVQRSYAVRTCLKIKFKQVDLT